MIRLDMETGFINNHKFVIQKGEIKMRKLTQELLDTIATYMNDEIREDVHVELAPCTPEEFLRRYVELDPDFKELLKTEFRIEL